MEENKSHIDDVFRDALSSYTETPPPLSWEQLESRIDADPGAASGSGAGTGVGFKLGKWVWYLSSVLLVATSVYVATSLNKSNKGIQPKAAPAVETQAWEPETNGAEALPDPQPEPAQTPVAPVDSAAEQPHATPADTKPAAADVPATNNNTPSVSPATGTTPKTDKTIKNTNSGAADQPASGSKTEANNASTSNKAAKNTSSGTENKSTTGDKTVATNSKPASENKPTAAKPDVAGTTPKNDKQAKATKPGVEEKPTAVDKTAATNTPTSENKSTAAKPVVTGTTPKNDKPVKTTQPGVEEKPTAGDKTAATKTPASENKPTAVKPDVTGTTPKNDKPVKTTKPGVEEKPATGDKTAATNTKPASENKPAAAKSDVTGTTPKVDQAAKTTKPGVEDKPVAENKPKPAGQPALAAKPPKTNTKTPAPVPAKPGIRLSEDKTALPYDQSLRPLNSTMAMGKPMAFGQSPFPKLAVPVAMAPAAPTTKPIDPHIIVPDAAGAEDHNSLDLTPSDRKARKQLQRPKWAGGVQASFAKGLGADGMSKFSLNPYVEMNFGNRWRATFQPGITYASAPEIKLLDNAEFYQIIREKLDSSVYLDTIAGQMVYHYQYTQTSEERRITQKTTRQTWEIELPLLLSYDVTSRFSVSLGMSAAFGKVVMIEGTNEVTGVTNFGDSLYNSSTSHSIEYFRNEAPHQGQPYSNYDPSAYQNGTSNPMRLAYMLGVGYEPVNRLKVNLFLQQTISGTNAIPDSRIRKMYTVPYLRVGIGYRLF